MSMWICGVKIKYKKMNVKDFSYIREKHILMKHLISALTIIAISAFSFQANAQETISSDAPEAIQEVYKPEKTSRTPNRPPLKQKRTRPGWEGAPFFGYRVCGSRRNLACKKWRYSGWSAACRYSSRTVRRIQSSSSSVISS